MSNVTVQSRVNPELKAQAESVFAGMGMSTADAIRIFLQQSVNEGGLPFKPQAKIPNVETIAAMQEAKEGKTTRYSSTEEMFKDLDI
jgi:DNA-damage-inducible protein J